ncbi:nucleotidyltransferase family protein [Vibrio sp. HN007]|uniref:nucleotidyltransferase family protein n=1 Tax=Vibrio iocasae TaxID=3098914 RepID=UPI0035D495FC
MIDLRDKDRQAIEQLARKFLVKGTELKAYGSRVKGSSQPASDLDLMMFTPEGEMNNLIDFQQALKESNIPIFVQVFDWNVMPENFKQNFLKRNESLLVV